jgi:hypothetical protein
MNTESTDTTRALAMAQGVYFAATGVWPLVHMKSFEAVTGPKVDKWLVKTVGVLVAVVGGVLVSAAARRHVTADTAGLAIGTAAALGAVDAIYVSKGRIPPVYLADAAVETVIVSAWAAALRAHARDSRLWALDSRPTAA